MTNVTHTLIDGVLFMDAQTDLGAQRYAMEISNGQIEFNKTKPMSKDKYKHAMEVIENWERVETLIDNCSAWGKPRFSIDTYSLGHLNDIHLFRIKREPRRVFVNFDSQGNPGNAENTHQDAIGTAHISWCSESAVEFVEVIKS